MNNYEQHIPQDDTLLLEWAGVEEHQEQCKLKIISLNDAIAECKCGHWHYRFTGERTKDQIEYEYNKHLTNKKI